MRWTVESRKKMSGKHMGSGNPRWSGNMPSYSAVHTYLWRHAVKRNICDRCGCGGKLDWANKDGNYSRNIDDYEVLCRSCHMKSDGRINNLIQFGGTNVGM